MRRNIIVGLSLTLAFGSITARPAAAAPATGATVWVTTQDSCQQALGGAQYQLNGLGYDVVATTASLAKPVSYPRPTGTSCPLMRGSCNRLANGTEPGCVRFYAVPPGTYRLHQLSPATTTTTTNLSYAPCTGGSACQGQWSTVTVNPDWSVSAVTTNVYPDQTSVQYPGGGGVFSAKQGDPIVQHDFGIGTGICDPTSTYAPENRLTGAASSHCRYPVALQASACTPYPWSCSLAPDAAILP